MGMSPMKSCYTNTVFTAPNPSPSRWTLIDKVQFKNSYVLKVKYHDCSNFEGVKIMIYEGQYKSSILLDPHFSESKLSPIARVKPTNEGWELAMIIAKHF